MIRQELGRAFDRIHDHRVAVRRGIAPVQAQVFRAGFGAGPGNVLRDRRSEGMGGVDHRIEAAFSEERLHRVPVQPPGGDLDVLRPGHQRLAVFGGHAGQYAHVLPRQELQQPPALGGTREYAELRHPDTPWASPSDRR